MVSCHAERGCDRPLSEGKRTCVFFCGERATEPPLVPNQRTDLTPDLSTALVMSLNLVSPLDSGIHKA